MALVALAGGCSLLSAKSGIDADIEDAQNNMRDSKKEYEACLRERGDEPESPCEDVRELYEDDKEIYQGLLLRKKAKSS